MSFMDPELPWGIPCCGVLHLRGTLNLPRGVTMAPGNFLEDKDMSEGGDARGGYRQDRGKRPMAFSDISLNNR
jgi:hypothetical protein